MSDTALQNALLAAHAEGDIHALATLYTQAADAAERRGEENAAAFFLTHARVFALEAGLPEADTLHARLIAMGRDS